jgi:hypothetical protein
MKTKLNRLAVAIVLTCVTVAAWYAWGGPRRAAAETYEINPSVSVPYGYVPTVDNYRLLDLVEELIAQNNDTADQLAYIREKLDSVDGKLNGLTRRMARIERALGIQPPPPPVVARPKEPNQPPALKQPYPPTGQR